MTMKTLPRSEHKSTLSANLLCAGSSRADLHTSFERARAYVSKIPSAIEGNHGDCQTLAAANALVWDFALSPFEALPILREYNRRCSPHWTDAELIRKLQSAERQAHTKPRGHLLAQKAAFWRRSPSNQTGQTRPADPIREAE